MSESLRQKEEEYTSRDSLLSEQWQSEDMQQRLQKQIRDEQRIRFEEEDRLNRMQEEVILSVYEVAIVLYYEVVIFLICANRSTISCSVSNWSERQNWRKLSGSGLCGQLKNRLLKHWKPPAGLNRFFEPVRPGCRRKVGRQSSQREVGRHRYVCLKERGWCHHDLYIGCVGTHLLDTRLADTLNHISEESNRLLEMERVHLQRQQSLLQQATEFKYRRQWADKAEQQAKFIMAAESDLQRQLLVLQRAAMTTETEMVSSRFLLLCLRNKELIIKYCVHLSAEAASRPTSWSLRWQTRIQFWRIGWKSSPPAEGKIPRDAAVLWEAAATNAAGLSEAAATATRIVFWWLFRRHTGSIDDTFSGDFNPQREKFFICE